MVCDGTTINGVDYIYLGGKQVKLTKKIMNKILPKRSK